VAPSLPETQTFLGTGEGGRRTESAMEPRRVGDADGESCSAAAQSALPPRAETHGMNQRSRGEVRGETVEVVGDKGC
jgi:hypothetical protein